MNSQEQQIIAAVNNTLNGDRHIWQSNKPHNGCPMHDTAFGTQENLDYLRDQFDKPLSLQIRRGSELLPGFEPYFFDNYNPEVTHITDGRNPETYIHIWDAIGQTLPAYFYDLMHTGAVNPVLMEQAFRIAASDGIATACATVLLNYPFQDNDTIDIRLQKVKADNERFYNSNLVLPGTEAMGYSKCIGFRSARALESSLIGILSVLEQQQILPLVQITRQEIGNDCAFMVEYAARELRGETP